MITIAGLNKNQLRDFSQSEKFKTFAFAPVSEIRAISHTQNPRAKESDILLFLAYDGDELAGYLGILPDDVTLADNSKIHFGWLSTIFVSEKFRGKQIAQKLLFAAAEAYEHNLLITEFTESAARLYNKIGIFENLCAKHAVRYYFKSNLAELLPSKKTVYENNKIWLKRLDGFINFFIPYLGKNSKQLFKIHKTWNQDLEKFLSGQPKNPIGRNAADFRWILDYPWLSNEYQEPDYLFSSYAEEYTMFWVSVYENQQIAAGLLCSVRNGHLKVLYYFGNAKFVINILPKIIKKYQVKMMTVFDLHLNTAIKQEKILKAIYQRPMERKYMIHKDFRTKLGQGFDFGFKDGDGDYVFT